jgi:hypothetical protein
LLEPLNFSLNRLSPKSNTWLDNIPSGLKHFANSQTVVSHFLSLTRVLSLIIIRTIIIMRETKKKEEIKTNRKQKGQKNGNIRYNI